MSEPVQEVADMVYEVRRLYAEKLVIDPQVLLHVVMEGHHFDPKKAKEIEDAVESGILAEIQASLNSSVVPPASAESLEKKKPTFPHKEKAPASQPAQKQTDLPLTLGHNDGWRARFTPQAVDEMVLSKAEELRDEVAAMMRGEKK